MYKISCFAGRIFHDRFLCVYIGLRVLCSLCSFWRRGVLRKCNCVRTVCISSCSFRFLISRLFSPVWFACELSVRACFCARVRVPASLVQGSSAYDFFFKHPYASNVMSDAGRVHRSCAPRPCKAFLLCESFCERISR